MTSGEWMLVAFVVALVLVAPKVGRIGERIGALFEKDDRADHP